MESLRVQGREGYVLIDVEAEAIKLPTWLDCRLILNAALNEYARQRADAIGPLPLPENEEAW